MANYYWVGGTGTWDAATTTNWASSSGGSGGAGVPTSADNAYFDGSSDTGAPFTVTISTGAVCKDVIIGDGSTVTVLDQTMTLAGSAAWSIYGSLYFPATSLTRTYTGAITFASTTTGNTITTNGVTFGAPVDLDGVGGEWTLGSAFTLTGSGNFFQLTNGSFVTANYNFTSTRLYSFSTNIRSLTLGSSTVTLSDGTAVLSINGTNLTLDAGTSTLLFSSPSPQPDFGAAATTWYAISYTSTGPSGTPRIYGNPTFTTFTAANRPIRIGFYEIFGYQATVTVTGDLTSGSGFFTGSGSPTLTVNGTATYIRTDFTVLGIPGTYNNLVIGGPSAAGVKTLQLTNNQTITGTFHVQAGYGATFNITDTAGAITAATVNAGGTGYNVGDVINVTGGNGDAQLTVATLSGTAIATVTISTPGTGYTTATGVATTLYSSALNPNRRVFIQSNSGDGTVFAIGTPRTITAGAVNIINADFRNIVGAGAATWNDSSRIRYWGNALGNSGITFSAGVSKYRKGTGNWSDTQWAPSSGGTAAIADFPLPQDTAVFDTGTTTGTHTINVGYNIGTLDMSALNVAVTLASGTTAPSFYGNITLDADVTLTGTGAWTLAGQGTTQTITSAGKTFTQPLVANSPSGTVALADALTTNGTFTLTQGALDITNQTLTCLTFSSSNSNTRSIAFGTTGKIAVAGNNTTVLSCATTTNLTVTGTTNFESSYSGATGTRTFTYGGTESNSLNLNITAGTDIVSLAASSTFNNVTFTGFSGTWSASTLANTYYGDVTISSGMTITGGTGTKTFAKSSSTQTLTTNSKTLDFPITKSAAGTLTLADNLTMGADRALTLTQGTLNLDGNTLRCSNFSSSNSNTRVLAFGSAGKLEVLDASPTAFNAATATNFTTTGTGTIDMLNAAGKTFAGGGATYPTLNQGGTSQLLISGANTFANISSVQNAYAATQRYNQLTYTEEFDNAVWQKTNSSITADQTTAPDGTTTADLFISNTTSGPHYVFRDTSALIAITSGSQYTFSVYLKKGTGATAPDIMQLAFSASQFPTGYANFNIGSGTIGTTSAVTASITVVGSGWYRCVITATATASSNSAAGGVSFTNNSDSAGRLPSYVDATTSDVFIWGAQIVVGPYAGTYQKVVDASTFTAQANAFPRAITFPANTTTSVQDFTVSGTASSRVILNSSTVGTRARINKV